MIVETFWFMIVVPAGAEMILAIRAAAASTSGSQSPHAVIDLVRHSSKNSARSSLALAGTQPSECEMKWTHSSRAGNALRYSSRLSATGSAMAWLTTAHPRLASRGIGARRRRRRHARALRDGDLGGGAHGDGVDGDRTSVRRMLLSRIRRRWIRRWRARWWRGRWGIRRGRRGWGARR